ncbi:MAG: Mercuric transport protein periplasmic component precursor [Microgenomates bacterium OLB22]|nr:MAG: Mercuric transport protein periplasmic component precursor [Microgenomates bacterium OLB22]
MKKITLKIQGMHCVSCPIMIDGKLEDEVDGVQSAQTNYVQQECKVEYDEAVIKAEDIVKAINELGYKAEKKRKQ